MPVVTLTRVADDHREFTTANGHFAAFKVWAGDSVGEVVTKFDYLERRRTEFKAIIGKPTELVVKDQGQWDDGTNKPASIKFPQQGQGGGGGRGSYIPKWTDTEVGAKWADDRIDRRRALELAVTFDKDGLAVEREAVLTLADDFYQFLKSENLEPAARTVASPEAGGMGGTDGAEVDGEAASAPTPSGDFSPPVEAGGERTPDDASAEAVKPPPPASPDEEEQKRDFRAYLAERYTTAQALLMARSLFQTQVRKIPNMKALNLDELQAIDTEFKAREVKV